MANNPTPDHTRWWLLWLFSTVVLPVLSGRLCIFLGNWLSVDGGIILLALLLTAVLCVWLLCFVSKKAIAPRKGALLDLLIYGGIVLQLGTGVIGCLVPIGH
jgi:heme A synthase